MKKSFYNSYFKKITNALFGVETNKIDSLYKLIIKTSRSKSTIFLFGNGANISTASHVATDFTKNAKIKTISPNDSNLITCFSNDYGFKNWIVKTLEYYTSKKDLVILLSASGQSKNLIKAAEYCRKKKITVVTITGFKKKNSLSKKGNLNLWIDSKAYNIVEIAQMGILLSMIDKKIGSEVYSSKL